MYAPNVHSSIIYNCQDIEATKLSINRWMDKEDVVCIYHGILLSHWNFAICNNMDGLGGITLSEIHQTEKDKYYKLSLICGI